VFELADLWPDTGPHDLIIANLPYVALAEAAALAPDVRDFEPHGALFAGDDGLELIRRLCDGLPDRLAPGGAVALEVGWRQAEAVAGLLGAALPDRRVTALPDLAGHLRMVCAAPAR
jgi:release factor glutamine methyltransferase